MREQPTPDANVVTEAAMRWLTRHQPDQVPRTDREAQIRREDQPTCPVKAPAGWVFSENGGQPEEGGRSDGEKGSCGP